jgi:hypothetical protein
MVDYVKKQVETAIKANDRKRKADAEKYVADATANGERKRMERALQHKAGAGRGNHGKPKALKKGK